MSATQLSSSFRVTQRRSLRRSRWVATLFFFLTFSSFRTLLAQDNPAIPTPPPKPADRIDLSAISYQGFSRTARLSDDENLSLHFVDADHVLLTFDQKKLFKRLPDCPPGHDDRLVRAVVLEISTRKVLQDAVWYVHDHRRYLWSLGSGKFLLRKLNSLYIVDSALHEQLLMASPKALVWVAVTPDKKQIIVETAENAHPSFGRDPDVGTPQAQKGAEPQFLLEFLDVNTLVPQRTIKLSAMVSLEGTSSGYSDTVHKGDLWLIRFGPTPGERHNVARVRSQTVPRVFYSSNNSLLVGRNPARGSDYSVTAFTATGRRLWRHRWNQSRYFPSISSTEDNSRFAVSTLTLITPSSPPPAYDDTVDMTDDPVPDGLAQTVQVLETASGTPVLSLPVSPAVQSGQNVALSPDGRRLAVLRDSALEFYDLPPVPDEEYAKFTALKADVPGLYVRSSKSEAESQLAADKGPGSDPETVQASDDILPAPKAAGPDSPDDRLVEEAVSRSPSRGNQVHSTPGQPNTVKAPEGTREPVTTIKVNTRAVVVDVVVADANGHPVKGLRQQDFQVMEDGKPQDVRSFTEVADAKAAQPPDSPNPTPPLKLPTNVFTNNTHSPEAGAVTMILLDLLNTPSADQQYARQQLLKFLKTKSESRQFALCTLTSDRAAYLRLLQGFTSDENAVLAAVSSKKGMPRPVSWQAAATGTGNAINTVRELAKGDPTNSFQGLLHGLEQMQTEQQATDTDARVEITIDALIQLARYLSGIPGRKNVVWLSGSFPISISSGPRSEQPAPENRNYANQVKQATNLLAEGQIAVYPVDVRGQLAGGISAADNVGIAPGRTPTLRAAGELGDATTSPGEVFQQQSLQALASGAGARDTMNQFALETGGMAFFNSNAVEDAISTATEQGSNYYSLSYSPANKNYNGKFRQIKVALAQKGYHLHYRQGYFAEDSSASTKYGDVSRNIGIAAMQHGSPQSRQIHFAVRVVPMGGKKQVDGTQAGKILRASRNMPRLPATVEVQHYGIDYAVDPSDLLFLAQHDVIHSTLNFMIAAYADDGTQLSGVSTVWTSDLNPTLYRDVLNGGVRVHQEVDVPSGAVSLRLGLQDKMTNHLGTIELPLPVPPPPDVPHIVRNRLPEIEPD